MPIYDVASWIFCALVAVTAGRWISVLMPALVGQMEIQWKIDAQTESLNVLGRTPGILPALIANRHKAWLLIPMGFAKGRHLAWEITTLVATLAMLSKFGMTAHGWVVVTITWALIALVNTDLKHFLLLDCLVYPLLWSGLLWRASGHGDPIDGIYGAFFGYAGLWLIAEGYGSLRGMKMMGNGDFKLTAALGAWLGWEVLPVMVLSACGIAIVLWLVLTKLHRSSLANPIPFGPALAIAGWTLLYLNFPG
jgi:Flp pilus assembly protein protease CpaA